MEAKIQDRLAAFERLKIEKEKELFAVNSIIHELRSILAPEPVQVPADESEENQNG